jgi:hypothetical protein
MINGALKAGIIGALVAIGLQVVNLIPCIGWALACLGWLILAVAVGVMAVRLSTPTLTTTEAAAGAGAIAGAITGAVGSLTNTFFTLVLNLVGLSSRWGWGADWGRWVPPEMFSEMQRFGIGPRVWMQGPRVGIGSILVGGCLGLIGWMLLIALVSALSAFIYQSSRTTN